MILQQSTQSQAEKFNEISKHFKSFGASEDSTAILLGTVAVLCLLLLILMFTRYLRETRRRYRPMGVFMKVGKSMGLGLLDRLWLVRVAKREGLVSPLTLLMSPATLSHHTNRYLKRLSTSEASHMSYRLRMIQDQLFGVEH